MKVRPAVALVLAVAGALGLAPACSRSNTPEVAATRPCSADDDCTLHCQSKGDCCRNPYCETPALATQARAIDEYNRDHCSAKDYEHCPRIGARTARPYRIELHCREGACVTDEVPCADGGTCG